MPITPPPQRLYAAPAHLDERRALAVPLRTVFAVLALAATLMLVPAIARASTAPDRSFGTDGSIFWGVDGTPQPTAPVLTARDGGTRIYAVQSTYRFDINTFTGVASLRVVALTTKGAAADFGTNGTVQMQLSDGEQVADALELPDGTLSILLGDGSNGTARLLQLDAAGKVINDIDLTTGEGTRFVDGILRSNGAPLVLVSDDEHASYTALAYDPAGAATVSRALPAITDPAGMIRGKGTTVIVASRHEEGHAEAIDLDEDLLNTGLFGPSGTTNGPATATVERLVAADGPATYWHTTNDEHHLLERWVDNAQDATWTPYAHHFQAPQVLVFSGDGVLLAGVHDGHAQLIRLKDDGTPDISYGTDGIYDMPTGGMPNGYEVYGMLRPFVHGDAFYVTATIGAQTSSRSIGSSTSYGYTRLWRVGTSATPTPEAPVDDRSASPDPALNGAAAPAGGQTTVTVASGPAALPAIRARRCVSRRTFTIRLRKGPGNRNLTIRHVTLTVAGERVPVSRRDRQRGIVNLTGLPKGRFTVRADLRLDDGQRVIDSRSYRTCALKKTSRESRGSTPDPVKVTR